MSKATDPLAAALDGASKPVKPTKLEKILADRPQVLDSIIKARKRKLSFRTIAIELNKDPNLSISEGAVQKFLEHKGIS